MKTLISIFVITCFFACRKHKTDPCKDKALPTAEFFTREVLSDTAFNADTIFRDNAVQFYSNNTFDSYLWKLGSDPRDFVNKEFNLSFFGFLGTINVDLTTRGTPNTQCFPNDNGNYTKRKAVTLVEQVDKALLTKSPLIGKYRGSFITTPNDVFDVSIDYFDSSKYDVTITGSKNFYWVSNFPKNFRDTTSSYRMYPELTYGQTIEMGYKCASFGNIASIPTGKSKLELKNDTLKIYYNHLNTGRNLFIAKKL